VESLEDIKPSEMANGIVIEMFTEEIGA